jgi:drug/metabolite transporter (DMT)-like permease
LASRTTSPTSGERSHAPLRGILFVLAGVSVFSIQDAIVKGLSGHYPLLEIGFIRCLLTVGPMAAVAWWERGRAGLLTRRPWLHLSRGSLAVLSFTSYYLALAALPLADVVALYFAAPLFLTALSRVILREPVGGRRWGALIVGFLGVLVVLRPGAAVFEPAALLAVMAALCYGGSQTITRELGRTDGAATIALASTLLYLAVCTAGGLLAGRQDQASDLHPSLAFLVRAWIWPGARDLVLMLLCGVTSGVGAYCLAQAYRAAPANTVAPFEYVMIVWAVLWGYLFWGNAPGPSTLVGVSMTVGAGLFLARHEALGARARRSRLLPASDPVAADPSR